VVELRREEPGELGPADVRIDAIASAISHGTEMLVLRGQVPAGLELDLPTLRGGFEFPIKYGYASVGRVVEAGPDATLEPGQAVFVHHPHQSSYVVPSTRPVSLPEDLDPLLGVFLANLETAINIVLDAAPRFGERVAIFGQGVVGLLVTQLVRRAGASTIVVVEPVPARRELATRLGADHALAPVEAESVIHELTEGTGVDVAIEVSGNVAALQLALDSLAFGGTAVVCSWYGTKPVALQLGGGFHRRRPRILSSQVSSIDGALQPRWSHRRRLRLALNLLPKLDLAPLISHRVPLEHAPAAYALIDQHPEQTVQVVLTCD
jgi:2-desacetyl-2-hydroxyethyl bacteriochlorophyllide A dehydrogenase